MNYLLLLLLLAQLELAKGRIVGASYYALQGFNTRQCNTALRVFKHVKRPALSILWGTFGDKTECLARWLEEAKDRPHVLEIHLTNETCLHKPRHCTRWDRPPFFRRLWKVADWLLRHKNDNTTILLSTGLEDDLSSAEYERRAKLIREITPFYVVRSRDQGRGSNRWADFAELHGLNQYRPADANACIFNNDGLDIDFSNGSRRNEDRISLSRLFASLARNERGCDIDFIWWNTQGATKRGFIEPRRRRLVVRSKDVLAVNRIIRRLDK